MVIVYCGELWSGGTCRMRCEALARLGHTVVEVDTTYRPLGVRGLAIRAARRIGWALDPVGANRALVQAVRSSAPAVVWIDKGLSIHPGALEQIRQIRPGVQLVHYSPDDMSGKHNQSKQYLSATRLYDLHVTTKSFNVAELRARGARSVLFLNNAYCPQTHRPIPVSSEERGKFGGEVGFIGAWEDQRAQAVQFLAAQGVPVRVWGGGWRRAVARNSHPRLKIENRWIWGEEYALALSSFDINLGFLRKLNRDLQTTRSTEIPACGGFLLAERTAEQQELFQEGVEAEFFGTTEELLDKCRFYLAHPDIRARIALAGRERCLKSDYSYDAHVAAVLRRVKDLPR